MAPLTRRALTIAAALAGAALFAYAVRRAGVAVNVAMPRLWQIAIAAALAAMSAGAAIALRAMRGTWDSRRGARPRWRERLASVRDEALRFSGGHPQRLWRVFVLDLTFHALA